MKKVFIKIALVMAGVSGVATAQQDPQFTQFMFNKLIYNAGYAGTTGAICGAMQYRQQWAGFEGGISSFAFSGDMRLKGMPLGVGMTLMTDKIGPMNTFFLRGAISYNITKLAGGTLGIGLDLGMLQKKLDAIWVTPEPLENDTKIPGSQNGGAGAGGFTNPNLNKITFDVGLGAFYQIPGKFYAGISTTHLPAQSISSGDAAFKLSRHFYFMSGYTFQLNKWSKLTPNVFYKTDVAANSLDLNLTYLWSDMIWVGATYRADDATCVLLGYQGKAMAGNALSYKIGYSIDLSTTAIAKNSSGTHEILVGLCYTPKVVKDTRISDPRFLD